MFLMRVFLSLQALAACQAVSSDSPEDRRFEELGGRYVRELPALTPVSATLLGDHRFDGELDQVMRLMVESAFQEESEAAAKWVRAQLTSAQLSTYFVGYLEITDLRREAEELWGDKFDLKEFHDRLLSYGSPPVRFVRALLLDREIPR